MCTGINTTIRVAGVGKGATGWFSLEEAVVGYDHSTHTDNEHALTIDFVNYSIGTGARVAIELDLESGRALLEQLTNTLRQAAASGILENV